MISATDLRCEFRSEPLGVDATHPRLSWVLQGNPKVHDEHQQAYRILVASSSANLAENEGDLWDSGKISSSKQNNIPYQGAPIKSSLSCHWKVEVWGKSGQAAWSAPATWETGILHPQDWTAQWIDDGKKYPTSDAEFYRDDPAPLFRKEFVLKSSVRRARLYITGLGYYEASLNGLRVGDHVLDPGWTKFDKRVFYSVYDVTRLLHRNSNCLGVMLGNGWYDPLPMKLFGSFNLRDKLAIGRPRLIAQLRIEYVDGSVQIIPSDPSWKVSEGPIRRNNIYLGELCDATKEQANWDTPGFDDSGWWASSIATEPVGRLIAQPQPPIRITSHWDAVKVAEPKPGVYVYDCGVNFAGWVRLKLNLPRGAEIKLRYGELIYPDGSLNPMTSVAGQIKGYRQGTHESAGGPGAPEIAWQADTFISRGGEDIYTPRFTFHGFRYVEITGLSHALPLSSVTALRLNSDVEEVGKFECSNPMLNNIQEICRRTFLSNIFSVQSDCPHRERLGYGGDIVATSEALMGNFDMSSFYEKVVHDWSDSALPNGMFTDTAPYIGIQYCGVIWAMAHPVLIDQLHGYYGNIQISEREYEADKQWLLLVDQQYPDGIVKDGLSDHESLVPNPAPEMVTPMYYESAKLLANEAERHSRAEDRIHFLQIADKIAKAYQARFVDSSTGKIGTGSQACQSFGLYTGIVAAKDRAKALEFLLSDIEAHKNHLTTGILGTKFMLDLLSGEGHADLAYKIATQPDFPGWGWMLKNGATTLWEHWAGSDNTYSNNHPMFGSVSQWMMRWLGGIQPELGSVGFDRIMISPQTPRGLDWVKSSYKSIRGKIVSNWSRRGDQTTFEVEIPVNTTARIVLPARFGDVITESGKSVKGASRRKDSVELNVGSGQYEFTVNHL